MPESASNGKEDMVATIPSQVTTLLHLAFSGYEPGRKSPALPVSILTASLLTDSLPPQTTPEQTL